MSSYQHITGLTLHNFRALLQQWGWTSLIYSADEGSSLLFFQLWWRSSEFLHTMHIPTVTLHFEIWTPNQLLNLLVTYQFTANRQSHLMTNDIDQTSYLEAVYTKQIQQGNIILEPVPPLCPTAFDLQCWDHSNTAELHSDQNQPQRNLCCQGNSWWHEMVVICTQYVTSLH